MGALRAPGERAARAGWGWGFCKLRKHSDARFAGILVLSSKNEVLFVNCHEMLGGSRKIDSSWRMLVMNPLVVKNISMVTSCGV